MENIAVIGSGTMGNGIAHVFAQNGFKVSLIDISEGALEKRYRHNWQKLGPTSKKRTNRRSQKRLNTLNNITTLHICKRWRKRC